MPYYLYILRCSDNTLYCGQTSDLGRRLKEHNCEGPRSAKYLRGRTPAHLAYSETFATLKEALQREYRVKRLTKKQKEKLITET